MSELWDASQRRLFDNKTNLGLALAALFAGLGGALVFYGSGRSQEDAGTFGAGESAVLVVVVVVPPGDVVGDQVPGVVRFVLGGKDWGDRGGDGADGGEGETTGEVDLGVRGEIEGEVGGEL